MKLENDIYTSKMHMSGNLSTNSYQFVFKDNQDKNRINLLVFLKNSLLFVIGLVFIMLGMSMIVLPAPPFFEMYVIFVVSPETGFTLMDLFSLIIVLFGVFFVINSLGRKNI